LKKEEVKTNEKVKLDKKAMPVHESKPGNS
jgi:hypothetical protein